MLPDFRINQGALLFGAEPLPHSVLFCSVPRGRLDRAGRSPVGLWTQEGKVLRFSGWNANFTGKREPGSRFRLPFRIWALKD